MTKYSEFEVSSSGPENVLGTEKFGKNMICDPNIDKVLTAEQTRFEKYSPLKNLLFMSVGPLIYQVGISFHDAIDLLEIAKAFSEEEMTIVGFASVVRYICMSFAIFFSVGCLAKISNMIGEGAFQDAGQVVADLYRICFIVMLIIPFVFYFITEYIVILMGCSESMASQAKTYVLPILICMPFIGFFQLSCGILQSEGRSIFVGFMQITALILNCGFFSPVLFFAIKVPFSCAGLGFALSQSIPGIVLSILIFNGKFSTLARWENLIRKPIKESFQALKLASPFILNVLMGTFPPIFLINFMMKAASVQGLTTQAGSVYSVFLKLQPVVNSFSIAFAQGMLASGSYAYGAGKHRRLVSMFWITMVITVVLQAVFIPILTIKPSLVASIWIDDQSSLEFSNKFIRIPFLTNWTTAVNEVCTALLQILSYGYTAMLPSIVRGVFYIVYSLILYYTNKSDAIRMMHVYNCNDMTVFVLDICITILPLLKLKRLIKSSSQTLLLS